MLFCKPKSDICIAKQARQVNLKNSEFFSALQNVDFRYFLSVRFLATFAAQMTSTLLAWQVYKITRDPLALGLIGLFEVLPFISMTLFAGHYVDKYSRKLIIVLSATVLLACSVALALFTSSGMLTELKYGIWLAYSVNMVTGIARAFLFPAMTALRANIIRGPHMQNSIAWNVNIWYLAAISGPALAGLLYDWVGVVSSYWISVAIFSVAIFSVFMIREKGLSKGQHSEDIWKSLKEGINFVFERKIILSAITLDLFAVLFGGVVALLPVFAQEVLHTNATGLGILRAAPFVGSLLSGIVLAARPVRKNVGVILLTCVALFGVANLLFSLSEYLWLSALLIGLAGVFDNVSVFIRHTIMQLYVPDNMRGRVSAVEGIFISSSNELGSFESGFAAKILGLIPSVVFGTSMTFLSVLIANRLSPELKQLDWSNESQQPE